MDKQTINEKYADMIVFVAFETGWDIDYILDLPPWTLTQVLESKERLVKLMNNEMSLNSSINNKELLGV